MVTLLKTVHTYIVFYNEIQYTVIVEKNNEQEFIEIYDEKGWGVNNHIFNEIENYFNTVMT